MVEDGKNVPKADPATLTLRANPPPTIRFKRGLVIGAAAAAMTAVAVVSWLALQAHAPKIGKPEQLYNTDRRPAPDAVAGLPNDYSAPKLGPKLPGDLGRPILERERQLGQPVPASAQEQAAEAERQRLAQQETQARQAGLLAQISSKPAPAPSGSTAGVGQGNLPTAALPGTSDRLNLDLDRDQNNQQRKLDFLQQKSAQDTTYNPHHLETPASPYQIMAGSVIAASLITGLNSDLPGVVTAQVTEPVFDSVTGHILLIPQGSRLIGTYDSVIAFGQSRALVAWQRIVLPDGSSIQIDNLPATDAAGYSGLEDDVDYHTWTLLKGIAMSTLLGVGGSVAFGSNQSNLVEAIRESTQESANQAGQKIVEKDLNIQPTITVRPGWPLRVIVHKDIIMRPWTQG